MSKEMKNAYTYPTDFFMAQLTCEIFENVTHEAGTLEWFGRHSPYTPTGRKYNITRLKEIRDFAKKNDYWWLCLEVFCPTIDRKKIRQNLKKVVEKNLLKLIEKKEKK